MRRWKNWLCRGDRRERILLLAVLGICSLFIYRDYLFGSSIFVFKDAGGDMLDLYVPQFSLVADRIREGSLSFWDFRYGFGANLFVLNLFDPFFIMIVFTGVILGTAHMLIYLAAFQILKIMLAGWLFYLFISEFSFGKTARFLTSVCFGLCGYLLVWGQHYQFGTALIYLPLCLLFAERFMRREKYGWFFPVCVFLLGCYSVYFSYVILAGTGIYVMFRTASMPETGRIKLFLKTCGCILLGLAMAMGIFAPGAAVIAGVSSRLEDGSAGAGELALGCISPFPVKYYAVFLKRLFSSHLCNVSALGEGKNYTGLINYYEDPVLYCSFWTVLMDLQFLFTFFRRTKGRERICMLAVSLFLPALTLLGMGSIILNGFVPYSFRYTCLLLIPMLMGAAWAWDRLEEGERLSFPAAALAVCGMFFALGSGWKDVYLDLYRRLIIILTVSGLLLIIFSGAAGRRKGKRAEKTVRLMTAALVLFQLTAEGNASAAERLSLKKQGDPYFQEMYREDLQQALRWLQAEDPEFYRIEKNFSSGTLSMDSMIQGYCGISTYNSVMNGGLRSFLKTCYPALRGSDPNHILFADYWDDGFLAAFTGVRYLLSLSQDLQTDQYVKLRTIGGVTVYKNVRSAEMARFYTRNWSEESLKAVCTEKNRRVLLSEAIALPGGPEAENAGQLSALPGTGAVPSLSRKEHVPEGRAVLHPPEADGTIYGQAEFGEDGWLMFMIPYEAGWTLTVDGQKKDLIRADLAFLSCRLEAGKHELCLTFTPPLLQQGMLTGAAAWLLWFLVCLRRRKIASGSSGS